jgi:tRNA threonylcarbamoyladenosine biosynthesis protein TsaB
VQDLLQKSNLIFKNLNAIAVSSGPGSYTGLRIGVSSAKGLCYALNIPLIAIDTLQIMAIEASKKQTSDVYLPMIDARRMEVYSACYDAMFQQFSFRAPLVMDAEKAKEIAAALHDKRVTYFGNGAEKLIDLFKPFHQFIYLPDIVPQAESMILPAFQAYQNQNFCDLAYFEPEYLKPFYTNHPAGA